MSDARGDTLRAKRVLLLQGPVGPFFRCLAKLLRAAGAEVHKVNFNGGDCLFYPTNALTWRGHPGDWPQFLARLLEQRQIDIVLLFGDCRPIHRVARTVAQQHGVRVGAFEEGYVRPNFITFEQFDVNGYSRIPRQAEFYRHLPCAEQTRELDVGNTFRYAALWAALYYVAAAIGRPWFARYRHHRRLRLSEMFPWLRSLWRKLLYAFRERATLGLLTRALHKRFFLVPLQISVDSRTQINGSFYAGGIDATASAALASLARTLRAPDTQPCAALERASCASEQSDSATLQIYASRATDTQPSAALEPVSAASEPSDSATLQIYASRAM